MRWAWLEFKLRYNGLNVTDSSSFRDLLGLLNFLRSSLDSRSRSLFLRFLLFSSRNEKKRHSWSDCLAVKSKLNRKWFFPKFPGSPSEKTNCVFFSNCDVPLPSLAFPAIIFQLPRLPAAKSKFFTRTFRLVTKTRLIFCFSERGVSFGYFVALMRLLQLLRLRGSPP